MINCIQIFGERNSGTHWLHFLLEDNLRPTKYSIYKIYNFFKKNKYVEITSGKYGWKHWFIEESAIKNRDTRNTLFVVIYKNPYSWLLSMQKNPWHAHPDLKNLSFSEFIKHEWHCIWDDDSGDWITNTSES